MKRLVTLLLVCVLLCGCSAGTHTAFTVDGVAVEKDELIFYMNRSLDVVVSDIETDYALDGTEDGFWETPAGDTTPLEILKSTAVKEISRMKVEMLLARENGIKTLPLDFSKQMSDWKRDNNNRQRKAAEGELVYGQVLRSFNTFFQDEFLTMRDELMWKLYDNGVLRVSEGEITDYYNANRAELTEELSEYKSTILSWLLSERYDIYINEAADSAEIVFRDMSVDTSRLS